MNELDARRHRVDVRWQRQREQVGADREQHVVLLEHFARVGCEANHRAAKQRVRRGIRRRVRHELGVDRRPKQFGEFDQLGMRVALRHRVARHDHRPLGVGEQFRRRLDRGLVATGARRNACRRHEIEIGVAAQDVAREREKHRPGRRRQRGLAGAVKEPRQIDQPRHLRRPLHQRPRDGRQVGPQDRLGGGEALLVLTGGDQDRRARLLRVVEHAHGVAQPGRDMQVDHRELAGRLRIAVRHRHDGSFLQAEDVTNLVLGRERIHQRQLGGAGIAEQILHAFLFQEIEEGALSGHDRQRKSSRLLLRPTRGVWRSQRPNIYRQLGSAGSWPMIRS